MKQLKSWNFLMIVFSFFNAESIAYWQNYLFIGTAATAV